jgi:hypothetical protein
MVMNWKLPAMSLALALTQTEGLARADAEAGQLQLSGYGDLVFSFADYGDDPRATAKGSKSDRRAVFDARRFILEIEKELPRNFAFEAELEIEHGGTGSAMELEYDEGGEYESEIEKGGEVQLEKLFLEHKSGPQRIRVGRIPIAFGLLPLHHEPFDYLGTIRPESEEHLIPSAWSELGAEYRKQFGSETLQLQIVNGFDSTGFSTQYFVRDGQQGRFEFVKATNPAAVLRWTTQSIPGLEAGASFYYGDSSANRPKSDLAKNCKDGKGDTERVAPCGYHNTPVQLLSLFAKARWGALQSQTSLMLGRIQDSDRINSKNINLPNSYAGAARTPVAEAAYSAWTEWGYGLDGFEQGDALIPFLRFERYDTVHKAAAGQLDDSRFDRHVLALGAAYHMESTVYFKFDVSERRFGSRDLRSEHELRFGLGFVY